MQVVLLCGGKGTRLSEKTESIPKPLIDIGDKPVLWHIMKYFEHHGHTDFILCTGYKGDMIKDYLDKNAEPGWNIKYSEAGEDATKSQRIANAKELLDSIFILSYGDDLTGLDMGKVIELHGSKSKLVTITAINPESGYGVIELDNDSNITSFKEKPKLPVWINGGYMVVDKKILDFLDKGELENEVFKYLAAIGKIQAYKYNGFWKSMNTLKENIEMNELWEAGNAPWKVWEDGD